MQQSEDAVVASNKNDVNQQILYYFQRFFAESPVYIDARLIDLGLSSIDYIELAAFLLKTTKKWLDISRINDNSKISDIELYLLNLEVDKQSNKKMLRLDEFQRYAYRGQLNDEHSNFNTYIIHYLPLKSEINLPKLYNAIKDTLDNHFILNSKLIRLIDDYYFVNTNKQTEFIFKGSFLFPQRDLARLIVRVQSNRLVNIYVQRKKNNHYLIISFHHIALDGWSYKIVQEEIFRRYAGCHHLNRKNLTQDIASLNKMHSASLSEKSNTDELKSIFAPINPYNYGHLRPLFYGKLQTNYHCFVLPKEEMNNYKQKNNIMSNPSVVVIAFMLHQMIYQVFRVNKFIIDISFSNRYLPIPGITELVANLVTGMPLFLDNTKLEPQQFAAKINETLKIYFKHMSYGAITRILLENNTLLNEFISPYQRPFRVILSYTNNTSKITYGNDSITGHYINFNKQICYVNLKEARTLLIDLQDMGEEFHLHLHSSMVKGAHFSMIDKFLKINFPSVNRALM